MEQAPQINGDGGKADDTSSEAYLRSLPAHHVEPLWSKMSAMVPPRPNPRAAAHVWRYADCLPLLREAAERVAAEDAERRVLMLVNPAMEAPHTTDTLYGGLQIVQPGETARAHRHVAFAARFIIDGPDPAAGGGGGGGFTAVEGRKMPLRRGDVVVTPSWTWHDHGNDGDGSVVWLDALDLPLFTFAPVNWAEGYSQARFPSEPCADSEWRHPWAKVEAALAGQPGAHAVYHYSASPCPTADGDEPGRAALSSTIGAQAERLDGRHQTPWAARESCSLMYHCYEGEGRTDLQLPSGEETSLAWRSRDTFVVPAGSRTRHANAGDATAYLVAFTDRPMLERLGIMH